MGRDQALARGVVGRSAVLPKLKRGASYRSQSLTTDGPGGHNLGQAASVHQA